MRHTHYTIRYNSTILATLKADRTIPLMRGSSFVLDDTRYVVIDIIQIIHHHDGVYQGSSYDIEVVPYNDSYKNLEFLG